QRPGNSLPFGWAQYQEISTELPSLASSVCGISSSQRVTKASSTDNPRNRLHLSTRPVLDASWLTPRSHPGQNKSRALCPHSSDGDTMKRRSIACMLHVRQISCQVPTALGLTSWSIFVAQSHLEEQIGFRRGAQAACGSGRFHACGS